jgi:two-component system osmolarity sensor histidine kinase EnvZ
MFWQWLKQYMPRGLYGRAALILLVPIVSIQLLVSVVFIQRHFNQITEQMTGAVVLELDHLVGQVDAAPTLQAARAEIAPLLDPLAFEVELPATRQVAEGQRFDDLTGARVRRTLGAGLPSLAQVDLVEQGRVTLTVDTSFGPMLVSFGRARLSASNPHQLLVIMVLFSILMTAIAYLFLRNQLKPIARLAHAAEAFGKGEAVPYRVAGATEVRAAGRAFLDMRGRIERQIESRTLMLSGVSHDLRTPLTRMKLGLAMMEAGEEREALAQDVAEMERLVDGFLSFARAEAEEGDMEGLDPADLVLRLGAQAQRAGRELKLGEVARPGPVRLNATAITRALDNLIGNATRYGSQAQLSLETRGRWLVFVVEDDGPGIAPAERERAMEPFTRLDAARNQNLGSGVGLGLAIAAEVARAHGGRLALGESAEWGGLRAELVLPL